MLNSVASQIFALLSDFNFALLNDPQFKEDSVREEIICPILAALGYTAAGPNKIIRSRTLEHPFLRTGSKNRPVSLVPDYLLTIGKSFKFVLDAKAPDEEISFGVNVQQVYSYATHPEIRVQHFGLCNGRRFTLFDIYQTEPLLNFPIDEIQHYWPQMEEYLLPFNTRSDLPTRVRGSVLQNTVLESYSQILPPTEITSFKKQAARRHFGVHGYFTRQVWSVVQHYIKTFSRPGDVVLDPFGGTGVTLVEALMLGRKGIHIDINPLSTFIVRNLIEPIDLALLSEAFLRVKQRFEIEMPGTSAEINELLPKLDYPRGLTLPRSSDVSTIEQLFSRKQLCQLALLKKSIMSEAGEGTRNVLLLMFSGLLNKVNLTYHSSKGRTEGRGDSSVFRYYRYRLAPRPAEVDVLTYFESRFKRVVAAKQEMAGLINHATIGSAKVIEGSATNLVGIANESVDYIYTDPPYGSKIPYLDLSVLWTSWLDLPITHSALAQEVIEGGEALRSKEEYASLLAEAIGEMGRVLKYDRWMSFVFAHKDPAYWHLIVEAAEHAGFEYAGAVKQSNGQTSFKKRQNPFTVLSGQLIISFRKVRNPKTIGRMALGAPVMDVVMETIESVIAMHGGATLEQINDELVIRGLEMGFLDVLANEYTDLTPLLLESFDYDSNTEIYNLRKNKKFKTHIPLELRVRYFVISYLRRLEHLGQNPTFDDIILNTMPLLKNGVTPEHQTILNVLDSIAERVAQDRWKLKSNDQQNSLFD